MVDGLPELEKFEIDEIVDAFKDVYQSTVKIVSARARKLPGETNNAIFSEWSQRGLERGTNIKISRTLLTDLSFKSCFEIDAVDVSHWVLSAFSKSDQFRAVIRTVANEGAKGVTKYYLEIWSEGKCKQTFDLAGLDEHGAVYTDDCFGSLSWSNQEDKIVYIAEQKEPKTSPFYQQKSLGEAVDCPKTDSGRGEQYVYEEDWGEVISPKRRPVIVSCDINKKNITVLEGVPKDYSPAQVIYKPNGDGVIGVAFCNTPRRLGVLYCTNRKSHIFHLSSKGEYAILSDKNAAVQCPRFSPDGKYLIWLQRKSYGGPHHAAHAIMRYNWSTKETTAIVDIIQDSILTKNGKEFFGVFNQSFLTRCWTSDGKYLLFSTPQKYRVNTYAVNLENGDIWDIGSNNEDESTIILDVSEDDYALLNATSLKQPSTLSSLHIPSAIRNSSDGPLLSYLTNPSAISDKNFVSKFTFYNENAKENCFATYYGPQNEQNESTPLILYPHGGPHASTPSAFIPAFHLFSRFGFGILIVHFHGSTGIGQKFVDSLPGKVGSIDADDCYYAMQTAFKKFPWLDRNRVVSFGGSYGGYLVAQLSSQYPNDFKAVVARNPVTNLILGFISDIPDWAVVESGFPYEGLAAVADNMEVMNKMVDVSPMKNIKNVKAPTLLLIGKKDLRVPPSQGLSYYQALKELNVPTKLFYYEDNHSLGTVPVEMDSIINSVIWFQRCLKRVSK